MHVEKSVYLAYRVCELILGLICFGLFAYYGVLVTSYESETAYITRVKDGFGYIAADAFPFLVQIPFLAAYAKYGKSFQYSILNPMVNLVGEIVYMTAGSMCIYVAEDIYINTLYASIAAKYLAVGSMFTITAIVYFSDLCYWMKYLRKEPEPATGITNQWGSQSPPHNIPMAQYGPPMSQPYYSNPNQQYGPKINQQYMADTNQQFQQYGPPMTQPQGAQMGQPQGAQMGQSQGAQMGQPQGAQMGQPQGAQMGQPQY